MDLISPWHLNPLNGLRTVHECDRRQTDRPRYWEMRIAIGKIAGAIDFA